MSANSRPDDPTFGARSTTDGADDPPLVENGEIDEDAVKATAFDVFERWDRDRATDAVRARVRNVASVSGLVAVLGWLVDFDGFAGLVLDFWFVASLPIFAVAGAIYATLRDPTNARNVWWNDGAIVSLGLLSVAALSRSAERSNAGRVAYQFLLGDEDPGGDRGYDVPDAVDQDRVRELRRYLRYAMWGSLAVVVFDVANRVADRNIVAATVELLDDGAGGGGGPVFPSIPALPTDPLSIAGLVVLAVVVGSVVGLLVGLRREL